MDKFIKYYKKEKEILTNKINEFNNNLVIEDNKLIKDNLLYLKI